jgi:hypothetical protein
MDHHRYFRSLWLHAFAATAIVVTAAPTAYACLGEYRSPDWLVGQSPLVIIGEVEKVEPGYVGMSAKKDDVGMANLSRRSKPGRDDSQPTVSTVRVLRLFKGHYTKSHVRIGSGPIHSCAPDEVHAQFSVGEQRIFILPSYPQADEVALCWGRSVLPLSEMELVESRVARAVAYRDTFLRDLRQKNPRTYVAAEQLAELLRKDVKNWPAALRDKKTYDPTKAYRSAVTALKEKLSRYSAETIQAALAYDWLADDAECWWRHEMWYDAARAIEESRAADFKSIERVWIRTTLARAGVDARGIDAYLKAAEGQIRGEVCFPPEAPWMANYFHRTNGEIDQVLTTDFILRYHSYHRGMMVPAYAFGFSPEVLAGLDFKRVKPLMTSLYSSDDERLEWLAKRAIGYIPGTEMVDLVLDDVMQGGHASAWRYLVEEQGTKEAATRLVALMNLAKKTETVWGWAAFWSQFREGRCFEPVCIERAVTELESLQSPEPKAGDSDGSDEDRANLIGALREYLDAAKRDREAAKPENTSAQSYRQWFDKHPPLKP